MASAPYARFTRWLRISNGFNVHKLGAPTGSGPAVWALAADTEFFNKRQVGFAVFASDVLQVALALAN